MLLVVDDNELFRGTLVQALIRRGFMAIGVDSAEAAYALAEATPPTQAVVDLNLAGDSGLALIPRLLTLNGAMRVVVLTGYASIATAVEAIRLGATHYLAKPAEVDEIVAAFDRVDGQEDTPLPPTPLSLGQMEWEHLQRALLECEGNISAAARSLRMHRRTLQRKLRKHAPW